jgi:hypothetical protein
MLLQYYYVPSLVESLVAKCTHIYSVFKVGKKLIIRFDASQNIIKKNLKYVVTVQSRFYTWIVTTVGYLFLISILWIAIVSLRWIMLSCAIIIIQ